MYVCSVHFTLHTYTSQYKPHDHPHYDISFFWSYTTYPITFHHIGLDPLKSKPQRRALLLAEAEVG